MSGIEVAGLVLGAFPILLEAIGGYKKAFSRSRSGVKKRAVVAKLGRALRCQKTAIEAIARKVLVRSGCDGAAEADDKQLRDLLQDKDSQELVDDLLGRENAQVLVDAFRDCVVDVSRVTSSLASLVPTLASVKNDTNAQAVLEANASSRRGQIEFIERRSIIINSTRLEREIEGLERSTIQLDILAPNLPFDYHFDTFVPSRKAAKLAVCLEAVRKNAVDLHSALTRQWTHTCHNQHNQHNLEIFLQDRIKKPKVVHSREDGKASCFSVAFVADTAQQTPLWHETLFYVESLTPLPAAQSQTTNTRPHVQDICAAITNAILAAQHPIFHLASAQDIVTSLHTLATGTSPNLKPSSRTLQEIFHAIQNQSLSSKALPWAWQVNLARVLASSFLQFIRTPWVQPSWSASNIHIPHVAGSQALDLKRPFLSAGFRGNSPTSTSRIARVRDDLLELGVLLLEIWHKTTLELQFTQSFNTGNAQFTRESCAFQWLDDLQNPLPEDYWTAVHYCIKGPPIANSQLLEWDDHEIREYVCVNVIDHLSKVR